MSVAARLARAWGTMAPRASLSILCRPGVVVLLVVVALLVALRIAAPRFVTNYLNDVIENTSDYAGEIEDVDIHLWRGAYSVHRLRIDQVNGGRVTPLFNAQDIHLSVEWSTLLHGRLAGEIVLVKPKLNVVTRPRREELREKKFRLEDLVARFEEFLPLDINRFAITDGEIHFRDVSTTPPIDIYLDQVQIVGQNLTNSDRRNDDLWATVSGTARAMGSGQVRLEMRLNPNEKQPTYQLAFELRDLRLTAINDYLKQYLSVVAHDGHLSLYAESKAKGGKFEGYVKPVVKDLNVLQLKPEPKSAGEAIKGFFVKLLAGLFENKPAEQLATRVDFAGKFDNPDVGVWDAVTTFMHNAFVALRPGLDASIAPRQAEKAEREPPARANGRIGRGKP